MSAFVLAFFQDSRPPEPEGRALGACYRVIYVRQGAARIDGSQVSADEAWHGDSAVDVSATAADTVLWRWELLPERDAEERAGDARLVRPLTTLDVGDGWLMRCDSVSFRAGGCAYTHVHQGPGIRCLAEGSIAIESEGETTRYAPGEPWFESGPDPVFAQADHAKPTRFIRVMILPQALLGQKSIRYVRDEDREKPKVQTYKLYVDAPIEL